MNIPVVFENKEFLIVNKPAGLVVHGDGKIQEPTLVDWIIKKYPEIVTVGENIHFQHKGRTTEIQRPGIVHRLDRDTSGLLLIVKTQASFLFFKKKFQNQTITKKYHALVYGHVKNDQGVINQPIGRHTKDFRKKMAGKGARGELREAVTEYRVLKRLYNTKQKDKQGHFEKYTLVECSPKTGRTHQIRVHMKWLNHPLVADPLYRGKRKETLGLSRTALHAMYLSFVDVLGETISVCIPLSQDIEEVVKSLSSYESQL